MTVIYDPTTNLAAARAAKAVYDHVCQIDSGPVTFGLPGGRSVVPLLEQMLLLSGNLSAERWKNFHFFMLDERLVPLDSPESNFRLLESVFFCQLIAKSLITKKQIHPFVYNQAAVDAGTQTYYERLLQFDGKFSAAIAGVGEDGHIGGLFPNHPSILSNAEGYIAFDDSPKPPPRRMSASKSLLAKTGCFITLFFGPGKQTALQNFYDNSLSIVDCPAKLAQKIPACYVVTDIALAENSAESSTANPSAKNSSTNAEE